MLSEKDLEAIAALMKSGAEKTDGMITEMRKQLESHMDHLERCAAEDGKRLERMGAQMSTAVECMNQIKSMLEETEDKNTELRQMLEEIHKVRNCLEKGLEDIKKNIDDRERYYRLGRLEIGSTAFLLGVISGMNRRIEELERKTA